MSATIRDGQTLLDVAICECGTAEAAWDIAVANGVAITDIPTSVDLVPISNVKIVEHYAINNITPATGNIIGKKPALTNS